MAGFLSYGAGKALSYQHDFGKDIDRLYQREAYKAQVEAEKERKASFYASMMKEQTAATPLNQNKLSMFYEGVAKEVADFAMNNPGWESDVMKSQKMYSIMDKYINNDIIREDQQVQQEWEKTKQAVNEGKITKSEYNALAEQYENYKENGGDAYVFLNPKRQSLSEIIKEGSEILDTDEGTYTDPKTYKTYRISKLDDNALNSTVWSMLADPDKRMVIEREYNAIDDPQFKQLNPNVFEFMKAKMRGAEKEASLETGYDDLYKLQVNNAIQNRDGRSSLFQSNVRLRLMNGERVPAHPANYSLTRWTKEGGEINATGKGIQLKTYDSEGNIIDMNFKGTLKSMIGGPELFSKGGIYYADVPVTYSFSPELYSDTIKEKPEDSVEEKGRKRREREKVDQNNKINYQKMSERLKDLGWQEYSVPSAAGGVTFGEDIKSVVWKGTVIDECDVSGNSRMAYDEAMGMSQKEMGQNQLSYDDKFALFEAASQKDDNTVNYLIKNKVGRSAIKSKGMDMRLNFDNLDWEAFDESEDPDHSKFRAITKDKDGNDLHLVYDSRYNSVVDYPQK